MKYNLSEITEVIRSRRSVSPDRFSTRKVHREQMELILTNGTWAPTHGLTQPWRFVVFMEDGLSKLKTFIPECYREFAGDQFKPSKYDRLVQRMSNQSCVVFLNCARDVTGKISEQDELSAVACCAQNMMLSAEAYGIHGFWSTPGHIKSEMMRSFLELSPHEECIGMFYFGYADGDLPTAHRKPLEFVTKWIVQ
ncbi:MAG: nitroreductase [Flavobacteriales bacterium]